MDSDLVSGRKLRKKQRKHYTDEVIGDEDIEGKRTFSVEEKLKSNNFNAKFVKEMKGSEFNFEYIQRHGFETPIVFYDKAGLGMRLPSQNFTIYDVRQCVGSRRLLDVMDVTTQKDIEMSMKDWCKYYENPEREKLLNVISLEFSHTRLENYVESPTIVRQVDWIDTVWPRHLKECQTESTNVIADMKYPKVQKYCLMSVAGCYTDFHIDFGGTSVWYHILHGAKVFWLIPPTERNLELYENWVLSGKQGDIFFGDQVEECARINLEKGHTFMIPTGWIHAVHTPRDSLVFGGNFLHSFNIPKQLRISEIEDATKVPSKFRYPFFIEMLWYVLERYLNCLTGKTYLKTIDIRKLRKKKYSDDDDDDDDDDEESDDIKTEKTNGYITPPQSPKSSDIDSNEINHPGLKRKLKDIDQNQVLNKRRDIKSVNNKYEDNSVNSDSSLSKHISPYEDSINCKKIKTDASSPLSKSNSSQKKDIRMTRIELDGIQQLITWLVHLPQSKRNVPELISDPDSLLQDVQELVDSHIDDDPQLAITGSPILTWPKSPKMQINKKTRSSMRHKIRSSSMRKPMKRPAGLVRHRRTRCKKCEACLRSDCGDCHHCRDMRKFGGPGRMKQSCISRQCMAPSLPHNAVCSICDKDEWDKNTVKSDTEENANSLLECSICFEITHSICLARVFDGKGNISDDLPSCWECPKCLEKGERKQVPNKPRWGRSSGKKPGDSRSSDISNENSLHNSNKEQPEKSKRPNAFESRKRKEVHAYSPKAHKKKIKVEHNASQEVENKVKSSQEESKNSALKYLKKPHHKHSHSQSIKSSELPKKLENGSDSNKISKSTFHKTSHRHHSKVTSLHNGSISQLNKDNKGYIKSEQKIKLKLVKSISKNENGKHTQYRTLNGKDGILRSICKRESKIEKNNETLKAEVSGSNDNVRRSPRQQSESFKNSSKKTWHQKEKLKREMKQGKHVVRPAPPSPVKTSVATSVSEHLMEKELWISVFHYLSPADLCKCMRVCKAWNRWCCDKRLWSILDLSQRKITSHHLSGIVRRQPATLNLSWTNVSPKQLFWLMGNLPQLKELILSGCSWATVSALCSCICPLLNTLDLRWVEGIKDETIKELLTPPTDNRPGFIETKSRLRCVSSIRLTGCDITDTSLRLLIRHIPLLSKLDVSYCTKITDVGIDILTAVGCSTRDSLNEIDLSGCNRLTDNCFEFLKRCPNLYRIDLRACPQVSIGACQRFIANSPRSLTLTDDKLIHLSQ